MTQKLLLVDFENVQQVDLARLDDSFQIIIFVGAAQKSIPIELVTNAQKLGSRIEWQRVDANGSNALDFFIACQLGRVLEKSPQLQCIVLSKDKGFDPLLRHLNKTGLKCKRLNSLLELDPKAAVQPEEPNYKRVIEVLSKSEKKSRPRKRKTLSQHISSIFQKKLPQAEVDRLIDILFANKMISETNDTITYEF
jgi:PIN domain